MSGDAMRETTLRLFAKLTGLPPLERLAQRGRGVKIARFTLHLADGRKVRIGTMKELCSQAEFGRIVGAEIGSMPTLIDRNDWHNGIASLISHATDVEDVAGEGYADTVREWVLHYARGATTDRVGAPAAGLPFIDGDEMHVVATMLAKWIRREYSEQVDLTELRAALGDLGFERCAVNYTRGGRRSSTSYYRIERSGLDDGGAGE